MANKILKTAFTSMLTDPSWIKLKLLSFMKQPSHYLANNLFPAMFKKFQFYKTLFTRWKMVSVYDCWKQINKFRIVKADAKSTTSYFLIRGPYRCQKMYLCAKRASKIIVPPKEMLLSFSIGTFSD